jgi:acyl dehydratase
MYHNPFDENIIFEENENQFFANNMDPQFDHCESRVFREIPL